MDLIVVLLLVCISPSVLSRTLEEEIPDNSLKVTFYSINKSKWKSDGSAVIFREVVSNLTNSHCSTVPGDCSLLSYNDTIPFTTDNVILDSDYPKETLGNDLEIVLYVTLTGQQDISEAGTDHVIGLATLKDILISGQDRIEDEMGYQLMFVGSKLVLPPIDYTMDIIMIPITLFLLFVVIIIAVVALCCQSRDDTSYVDQRRKSKVSPSPSGAEEGTAEHPMTPIVKSVTNTTYETKKEKKKKVKKSSKHADSDHSGEVNEAYALTPRADQEKEYNIKPQSPIRNGTNYDDNLDIKDSKQYDDDKKLVDTHHRDQDDSDNEEHRRRHKKKKRKKHRGRKHRDTSSETDDREIDYQQPLNSARLPPLSEPSQPTTEL